MNKSEFLEKYGEEEVTFSSYYKYTFYFENKELGISIGVGGDADEIYRLDVDTTPTKINSFHEDDINFFEVK